MSAPIISIENLSKRYLVGHRAKREPYVTIRDILGREIRNAARKTTDLIRGRQIVQGDTVEEFWALKDVSFEVREGEVLGIIGRNGAGKSTLLKILSRIVEPTSGRATIEGRVASLLEVGTGFHPELSGRENIYLNGAILGMSRADIRRRFDEIVDFAGVEKFLDTPVKRYSSGMYVRLAFAVAAHLEPEILIVDEVLAVGDAEFQKKCLGKMDEVSRRDGRTVLLVSHNMSAIGALADRAILLEAGSLTTLGPARDVIARYVSKATGTSYQRPSPLLGSLPVLQNVEVMTSEAGGTHAFGRPLEVKFVIEHPKSVRRACLSFEIINQYSHSVIHAFAYHPEFKFADRPGRSVLVCRFPNLRLNVGRYHLRCFLSAPPGEEHYETLDSVCEFEVVRTDRTVPWGWRPNVGVYHEDYEWQTSEVASELAL